MGDLPKRLGVALWGIPLLLLALYFGGLFLAILISLLLFLLAREWQYLGRCIGTEIPLVLLWLSAAAVLLVQFSMATRAALSAAILILLVLFAAEMVRSIAPMRNLGHLALWIAYIAIPISLWWPIRISGGVAGDNGRAWLLCLFLSIWATDTAAYGVGSLCGKHKLLPKASPNKSWEGAVAGAIAALLVPILLSSFGLFDFVAWDVMAFGVAVGVFGQAGDLLESLMKREAGVKDSSRFLPGHGGLLDRFDSLFFATPVLYLYLLVR